MAVSIAKADETFNSYMRQTLPTKQGIDWALAQTIKQIGPGSMPPDYVPPPLRNKAAGAAGGPAKAGVYEITVGAISWINPTPCPVYRSEQVLLLDPDWVPKTYLGLNATSNTPPTKEVGDFKAYQNEGDFRALMFCRFALTLEEGTGAVTGFEVLEAAHDGGWTPPFKISAWPGTALSIDPEIYSNQWHQGEYSPVSVVRTRKRHKNTMIKGVKSDETVLVNGLVKFRAGSHTDTIGVTSVKAPFHVPWVWCEMLLTYADGKLTCYGRGSVFPSHAWYVNGRRVFQDIQTGDLSFPMRSFAVVPQLPWAHLKAYGTPKTTIDLDLLNLYKVMAKGVPASQPQSSSEADRGRKGKVSSHPNTVWGSKTWVKSVSLP
jgi:hypothetical protein